MLEPGKNVVALVGYVLVLGVEILHVRFLLYHIPKVDVLSVSTTREPSLVYFTNLQSVNLAFVDKDMACLVKLLRFRNRCAFVQVVVLFHKVGVVFRICWRIRD